MQKRRGCRGRAAKRRSREKWLEKIGAEFVMNSHQELEISGGEVLVDKGVDISAVEAAVGPVGSSEKCWGAARSALRLQGTSNVEGDGAADFHGGIWAHLCCMAIVIFAVWFVPIWARGVVACGVVACGVVACCVVYWATQEKEDDKKELPVAAVKRTK